MMRLRRPLPRLPRRNGGFVLVMVIFLIVVLAGAAVAISQLTVDTSAAQNQSLQTTRARLLNQSGIEIATQYLVTASSPSAAECAQSVSGATEFPGLDLNLDCSLRSYNDVELWTLTAVSTSTGLLPTDQEYVWQRSSAVVEVAP